ncbi:MAG: ATP-dependent Clp protease proteolytic subunit [Spirochaetaceae bacterium]|jgi:ATP-dependent Clp protease protease subunit|nr:ATP-dependent Clp protease proteolytic subunit [Spirochaetaceae bacterium]
MAGFGYNRDDLIRRGSAAGKPFRYEDEEEKELPVKESEGDPLMLKFMKTRQILLSGEINKPLAERIIRQLLIMEADSSAPIQVFIDSPGGDADAGYAIVDMIRFISAPVFTIGMGLIASAGSLILLAAPRERRLGLPDGRYLIHQPLSGIKGVATEIEIHAQELEKLRVKINRFISDETGKPIEQVQKDTDRDFWMNAEEALDYGLISKVISRRDELKKLL